MTTIDVTDKVDFGAIDDECLPLIQCVCGEKFAHWALILSIYPDDATKCPSCNRQLYFRSSVRVYQVNEVDE